MTESCVPTKATNILAKVINIKDSTANIIEDSAANIIEDSTTKVIETPTIPITAPIVNITKAKLPKRIILVHEVIPEVSIYIIFNEKTFNWLY